LRPRSSSTPLAAVALQSFCPGGIRTISWRACLAKDPAARYQRGLHCTGAYPLARHKPVTSVPRRKPMATACVTVLLASCALPDDYTAKGRYQLWS